MRILAIVAMLSMLSPGLALATHCKGSHAGDPGCGTPPGAGPEIAQCAVLDAPGVYRLTADLPGTDGLLASGNCLEIAADGVTVDLDGRRITGPGTSAGAGISDAGAALRGSTVRGGTISGFGYGVALGATEDAIVEDMRLFDNAEDGIVLGPRGVARDNVAVENGRGLVLECPANYTGNALWDNLLDDLVRNSAELCGTDADHNAVGTEGGTSGGCTALGFAECAGACVDTATDEGNCGACGTACAGGEVCSAGTCALTCQAGLSQCGGTCVNLSSDETNCGSCGNTCGSGERCSAGSCQLSCQSGLDQCGGVCRDLSTDEQNCGACGTVCASGQSCSGGVCTGG